MNVKQHQLATDPQAIYDLGRQSARAATSILS